MKYLFKNSNLYFQNYTMYNRVVLVEQTLKKVYAIFNLTKLLRVINKYYQNYMIIRRQAFIVHPNQRINTNLDWAEILRSR
jgi:hypothetical protein